MNSELVELCHLEFVYVDEHVHLDRKTITVNNHRSCAETMSLVKLMKPVQFKMRRLENWQFGSSRDLEIHPSDCV